MDFTFLDYIWRGLTVGTLSSATVLAILFGTSLVINKKATRQQMKFFFHAQVTMSVAVFILSFAWVVCVDPELASGCFSLFAKDKSFFTVTRLLAALWVTGFVGFNFLDILRIRKSSDTNLQDPHDKELLSRFQGLVFKLEIKSGVVLKLSKKSSSPYAEGLFSHKVVLPADILQMSSDDLTHVMAHELVHVRDRDSVWKMLELLGRRILFFNPFVYFLAQRHLLAIEMAADEEAVAALKAQPQDYIRTLIEVVSRHRVTGNHPLALNASRTFAETKERMEALVLNQKRQPKKTLVNSMIFGSVMISLGFSVAQARSTVQESFERNLAAGMMCSQVHHEQMIESWLRIPVEKNKCEE